MSETNNSQANPLGIDGFEFIEFAAPDAAPLRTLFLKMGFELVAEHKTHAVTLYEQGHARFVINDQPGSFAKTFAKLHGPCACGFAMRVADARRTREFVLARGATLFPATHAKLSACLAYPGLCIEGIGSSALYLIDERGAEVYPEFRWCKKLEKSVGHGVGLQFIDHLTHNVEQGQMSHWADFYERLFGFKEIRYFDIKGNKTGLHSRAMTAPDGQVRIPINESADDHSQIAEYLQQYQGEGIQHIALFTDDIYHTVEQLHARGVGFLDVPDAYYELIPKRIPKHQEDLKRLEHNRILIDADPEDHNKKLLQIFTENVIGPIFFEIIQRKGNEGFGEGNFQALFESIEREQERRGKL